MPNNPYALNQQQQPGEEALNNQEQEVLFFVNAPADVEHENRYLFSHQKKGWFPQQPPPDPQVGGTLFDTTTTTRE
jgi:hypothetical protein